MPQFLPYLTGAVWINLFLVMEGYRSEKQSALQKRTVERICGKSNHFHKWVIKNPARFCDKKIISLPTGDQFAVLDGFLLVRAIA
jgi:hypothetical protein